MKTLSRTIRTVAALSALFVLPCVAPAAQRVFSSLTAAPASTNITSGVATNVSTTVTIATGTSGSTSFTGTGLFTLSISPPEPTVSATITPTTFNLPTRPSSSASTLTVTTTANTPSNTYIVTIVGNTNPPLSNVTPITNTFIVTMNTAPPLNPVMVWNPAGANTNWSTAANWSPAGPPGAANDVKFFDTGATATPGTIDNVVDATSTIASLIYGQTNLYHTTLIPSGVTLTLTGTNGLTSGTASDAGDGLTPVNTVTGTGTLAVNNASATINVTQAHPVPSDGVTSTRATLDLSGLDTFTTTASRLIVGADLTVKGAAGTLNLAQTNRITLSGATAPQLDVGDNTQSGGTAAPDSTLLLGQTNAFFVDSITVGRGKCTTDGSTILFNSSFANPVAYFRGSAGAASRVGTWAIGDSFSGRIYPAYGTNDFSLGTVDAMVDTMYVGKGASSGNGNRSGNGTLILSAGTLNVNTLEIGYAGFDTNGGIGTVLLNGGSLVVNTNLELGHGSAGAGALTVSGATVTANAGIAVGGGTAAITLNNATLNVTNSGATVGSAVFPLATFAVTDSNLKVAAQALSPTITVTALQCGGTANTLNISSVPLITTLPARYQLIQYSTSSGDLSTFVLGTLPTAATAYQGYLSNDTANSSIDLVITNGPVFYPLIWTGAGSADWDINTTANWKSNGVSVNYQQGYLVAQFDDTLARNSTVNLTTTLTPGSVTVNNSLSNYTFSGAGKLSGSASLIKTGTASLTLAETGGNDFTGGITVNGGTLQVGNGGANGTLGAGAVSLAASTALVFNRSDNVIVPNLISGLGTLTKNGANILTLSGSNSTFAGQIIVAQGTLQAGHPLALGTVDAGTTINDGATLDVNGQKFANTELITATGAGVGGNGAIVNNSTNSPNMILRNVTLTGNTTFGGASDWDIHASANPASDASLNTGGFGYKLTKISTNTVTLFGVQVDSMLGDIDVQGGTLSVERNTTGLGDSSKTATVFTNATLQFGNASNIWYKTVVLKDGATLRAVNIAEFGGPVALESGVGALYAGANGLLKLDAAVSGAGGLTKNGVGAASLAAINTYTGSTLVNAGTLALSSSASIDTSTNITVASGAILDLSALPDPTLIVTSGRALKGSGTVVGNVTMATGSTLVVGGPGTNTLGTLTITNNLVLQAGSTNQMEVGKVGASVVNDQVVATNVTYGGTLVVTGAGGAFVAGDTFKLFSAVAYGGSFSATNLPVGVTWDTTRLGVDGTIKVVSVMKPVLNSITAGAAGAFNLAFSGPGGNTYRVWASTNVAATPIATAWSVVSTGQFTTLGTATFADTAATNYPARFYLISVP